MSTRRGIDKESPKRVGLALGGGGAKGVAHVFALEVLDEMGIIPHIIVGTSAGALMGMLYAAGMSAGEIREHIEDNTPFEEGGITEALLNRNILKWFTLLHPSSVRGGLLNTDRFMEVNLQRIGVRTFGELKIPLRVIAADFWKRQQVIFESGELMPAVQASMALPGIFTPVVHNHSVLVDGGTVNPVPYDVIQDDCDITVAVNVAGRRSVPEELTPSFAESLFNTFQIYQASILREKIKRRPPDILLEPEIVDIRIVDFHKARHVLQQASPIKERMKEELKRLLGR